jgi:hypothetical protein
MAKTKPLPKAWTAEGWTERRDLIAKLPLRVQALLTAEWAADSLPLWVVESSPDYRPAAAIEASLQWVSDPSEQKRNAAYADAYAAAYAAYAAAYAAAYTAYAAYAADAYAAAYAAYAAAYAAKWKWLYRTFRRCRGPKYAFAAQWRTTEAVALAQGMWSRRRADCLPILADALEEAGLTDQAVLRPMREEPDTGCLSEWVIWNLMEFDK